MDKHYPCKHHALLTNINLLHFAIISPSIQQLHDLLLFMRPSLIMKSGQDNIHEIDIIMQDTTCVHSHFCTVLIVNIIIIIYACTTSLETFTQVSRHLPLNRVDDISLGDLYTNTQQQHYVGKAKDTEML